MKNFITTTLASLLIIFGLASCNDRDDDYDIVDGGRIKIDSVIIPQSTMAINTVQTIRTYSDYASGCEGFDGYDYNHDGLTRNVTAYKVRVNRECGEVKPMATQLNFRPVEKGTYTFRFWNGKGITDEDTWIIKEVVVN